MKKILIILSLTFLKYTASAQEYLKVLSEADKELPFAKVAAKINKYFDTARFGNKGGYKQWKREEWFSSHHLSPNGRLGNYATKNMEMLRSSTAFGSNRYAPEINTGGWYSLGHTGANIADFDLQGRINCLAFDPLNPAIIYAGAAGGGIWKSVNYGANWQSITDGMPIIGTSAIATDPGNGNIIYAITGDGNGPNAFSHRGFGIIKSTDGGTTWSTLKLSENPSDADEGGYKLLINPNNPNIIFAAMRSGLWSTSNAGQTWTRIYSSRITDIEFKPGDNNILYFTSRVSNSGLFLKRNLLTNQQTSTTIIMSNSITRIELAVTPANPSAVFILAGPSWPSSPGCPLGLPTYNGLFYSADEGTTFSLRNNNLDIFGKCRDQSDYDMAIYVSPTNENNVIIAGIRCYVSINGGNSFSLADDPENSVSHDCHAIEKNPLNGDIYIGNDGGVHRSTNSGASWSTSSNGLVISEYHRLSGFQGNNDLLLGGTQDNGLMLRFSNSPIFYSPGIFLDFMDNIIDHTNSNIMYACSQNGGLNKSVNGGLSFTGVTMPDNTRGNWITPIVQSPAFAPANTIYYGSNTGILRTPDGGATWANIGGQSAANCLAIGAGGSNITLYASANSSMLRSDNPDAAIPSWLSLTTPTSSPISSVTVNPADRYEVWITCSGYNNNDKVYRSINGGISWTNLSLSLPNIPVYSVVFANNTNSPSGAVYIGTETGVFYTDDLLPDWEPFYNGLPMVPVTDLFVHYATGNITAATYGRGIWRSESYNSCPGSLSLSGTVNGAKFYQSWGILESNQVVTGSTGNNLKLKAAEKVILKDGFRSYYGSYLHVVNGSCGSGVPSKANIIHSESTIEKNNVMPGNTGNNVRFRPPSSID